MDGAGRRAAAAIGRLLAFVVLFLALQLPLAVGIEALGVGGEAATALQTAGTALLATVTGVVLLRWLDGRRAGALGIAFTSRTPAELGLGFAIGGGALVVGAAILAVVGFLRYTGDAGSAGSWLAALGTHFVVLAVAAYAEEALFRGYPLQVLVRGFGAVPATLVLSALFALAHANNPNVGPFALLNIFAAGILLSAAYLRTASLWFATAVHLGWNWAMASLLDLPVSGIEAFETPLYEPVLRGPDWITGGAFGPEAGVIGTLGFVAALVVILRMRLTPAPEQLALAPLIEDRTRGSG